MTSIFSTHLPRMSTAASARCVCVRVCVRVYVCVCVRAHTHTYRPMIRRDVQGEDIKKRLRKKKIEEEVAKKDAQLHKYGDIEAIKRFVTETDAKCTSEGQEKVLAECPQILFFRDLAKLAVEIMKEAKKEFATRWTVKKMLCASTYKERLDNFKSDIEK